ncbi:hypothetical protein GC163_00025 [bacterium]|nr:hypothetical protein [bacterium]
MAVVIGIDEAGLGPNLGPFVVSATVWQLPEGATPGDLPELLATAVSCDPKCGDGRLVLGDSKQLFQPHQGLHRLEASVLALCSACGHDIATLKSLSKLIEQCEPTWLEEPWWRDGDHELPIDADLVAIHAQAERLASSPVKLLGVCSRVVPPGEFNQLLASRNKAELTTGCHLELLRAVCAKFPHETKTIFSDKHGGRNRYAAALSTHFDGAWIETLCEGPECSEYRWEGVTVRFEPRAEKHLPVAAASMVSKYLREVHMTRFNQFWLELVPGLKPTQGYPLDARRFLDDIRDVLARQAIDPSVLWRVK